MNLIQKLEEEEIKRMGRKLPEFSAGDTVIVNVSVVEGERKRVQAYEGVVIASAIGASTPRSRCAKCPRARASSAPSRPIRR